MPDVWDEMNGVAGSVEREARREQEVAEAEAQQLQLASRTLTDVAWEAMQQGRQVRLRWIGGEMAGVPVAAVGDLIVIRTEDGSAGVNAIVLNSIETTREGVETGTVGDRTVESFIAWCRMVGERQVRVAVMGGRVVDGVLTAVASDHLLIRTRHGTDVAVMQSQVAAVSIAGDLFVAF